MSLLSCLRRHRRLSLRCRGSHVDGLTSRSVNAPAPSFRRMPRGSST